MLRDCNAKDTLNLLADVKLTVALHFLGRVGDPSTQCNDEYGTVI